MDRNDFISDADAAPPNHGAVAYAETELVWYDPEDRGIAPMFPYQVSERRWYET